MALHLGGINPYARKRKKQHLKIEGVLSQGKISVKVPAMIDSGATGIFIDEAFAKHLGLKRMKRQTPVHLTLFDGSAAKTITHQIHAEFLLDGLLQELTFEVTTLSHYAVVLGLPWLKNTTRPLTGRQKRFSSRRKN